MNNKINCAIDDQNITLPKYESICASGMDLRAWKYSSPHFLKETNEFPVQGLKFYHLDIN